MYSPLEIKIAEYRFDSLMAAISVLHRIIKDEVGLADIETSKHYPILQAMRAKRDRQIKILSS